MVFEIFSLTHSMCYMTIKIEKVPRTIVFTMFFWFFYSVQRLANKISIKKYFLIENLKNCQKPVKNNEKGLFCYVDFKGIFQKSWFQRWKKCQNHCFFTVFWHFFKFSFKNYFGKKKNLLKTIFSSKFIVFHWSVCFFWKYHLNLNSIFYRKTRFSIKKYFLIEMPKGCKKQCFWHFFDPKKPKFLLKINF